MQVAKSRPGYTLMELLLVMAIIIVTGALSVPAWESMMSDTRVKAARDIVQARLADIRGQAMKEGRPYILAVMNKTGKFKVGPEDENMNSEADEGEQPLRIEGELPETVLFSLDNSSVSNSASGSGGYQTIAVFLPDGTARDDVSVMFGKEGGHSIGVQVRALTGAVTMVDDSKDHNK